MATAAEVEDDFVHVNDIDQGLSGCGEAPRKSWRRFRANVAHLRLEGLRSPGMQSPVLVVDEDTSVLHGGLIMMPTATTNIDLAMMRIWLGGAEVAAGSTDYHSHVVWCEPKRRSSTLSAINSGLLRQVRACGRLEQWSVADGVVAGKVFAGPDSLLRPGLVGRGPEWVVGRKPELQQAKGA